MPRRLYTSLNMSALTLQMRFQRDTFTGSPACSFTTFSCARFLKSGSASKRFFESCSAQRLCVELTVRGTRAVRRDRGPHHTLYSFVRSLISGNSVS